MIDTRIITTKDKKMLDRIFKVLGIDVNEFLKVNNLGEILYNIESLKNENEVLKKQIDTQLKINDELVDKINELNLAIERVNQKIQQDAIDKIWDGDGK